MYNNFKEIHYVRFSNGYDSTGSYFYGSSGYNLYNRWEDEMKVNEKNLKIFIECEIAELPSWKKSNKEEKTRWCFLSDMADAFQISGHFDFPEDAVSLCCGYETE